MSERGSYALLLGQLLLVVLAAALVAAGVQALGGPAPHLSLLTAGVGTALVVASGRRRRLAGAERDPALEGCTVRLPVDRWPVGGLWQNRLRRRTRAGWAPGVLGLAEDRAVFAPSRAREADRAWQDAPRAVQLRGGLGGRITHLRVHGRRQGTVQLVVQAPPAQVRAAVEQVHEVDEGWEETVAEPPSTWEPRLSEARAWPYQYSVRLLLADDTETRVEVLTWGQRDKAEQIARGWYGHREPDGPAVRDAVVVDIGPGPRSEDGRPSLRGMVFDHEEWR